ncbi:XRCC3 [Acanthosepion pharaonis]|uniref:XRCC3 n=1 Tax=Acanthosepion pharaonis TaxID=158019 RepID=A0A812BUP5_ACAPH|nr:XRCC3 [Sepia pharaonis]
MYLSIYLSQSVHLYRGVTISALEANMSSTERLHSALSTAAALTSLQDHQPIISFSTVLHHVILCLSLFSPLRAQYQFNRPKSTRYLTTDLSARDVQLLQKSVADCVPRLPAVTVLQLYKNDGPPSLVVRKLSMGCHLLDKALKGGIISRGITEIAGESASGKTQFCLQLSLTVQLPEENGGLAGG